jgi:hypothetical protein
MFWWLVDNFASHDISENEAQDGWKDPSGDNATKKDEGGHKRSPNEVEIELEIVIKLMAHGYFLFENIEFGFEKKWGTQTRTHTRVNNNLITLCLCPLYRCIKFHSSIPNYYHAESISIFFWFRAILAR